MPVADDISEEEMSLLAEEKELMEFEEIEAEAFSNILLLYDHVVTAKFANV